MRSAGNPCSSRTVSVGCVSAEIRGNEYADDPHPAMRKGQDNVRPSVLGSAVLVPDAKGDVQDVP